MKTKIYLTVLFIAVLNIQNIFAAEKNSAQLWSELSSAQAKIRGEQLILVRQARYLSLDINGMRSLLANAPMEGTVAAKTQPMIFSVPMPDGSFSRFAIVESPIMHPALAAKYPMIKTYSGQGLDDAAATIRLDVTQFGFHAMILSPIENVFIDPVNLKANDTYVCYYKKDEINNHQPASCGFNPDDENNRINAERLSEDVKKYKLIHGSSLNRSAGTELRTYRLAMACTGEYAAFYGGTTPGALAGIVTSVNRVTQVYELEQDVRMTLIANDDTLIFLNAATDPYTNNNGATMLGQNQTTVNARIGAANYDIGHVFSTGGGGIAGLSVVCQNNQKANGVTGLPAPVGDGFDIDFVAHEMGHQYGTNHSFNSITSGCNGNRSALTAYEPGSGISVMGYAGVCGSDDLAAHSIPYFHTANFDEVQNFTTIGGGNSCPVVTATGNNPPVSALTTFDYSIPLNTPFKLTGAGSDPDGDTITYAFDEHDRGAAGTWNAPVGNAPIFMPYVPTLHDWRLFPKLSDIRANINTRGDLKPSYARVLHFRLTLRDNRTGGGGITYDDNEIAVTVVNTVNPFAITYPDTVGIIWPANSTQTITWDVASTDLAPISTSNVNIYLSPNSGKIYPFPVLLAWNVPNTGSYTFTVPNNQTDSARILIEAAGNIFLNMNHKDFRITAPIGIDENTISGTSINVYPNPSSNIVNVTLSGKLRGSIVMNVTDAIGKIIYAKNISKDATSLVETINIENYSRGIYFVRMDTNEGSVLRKIVKL